MPFLRGPIRSAVSDARRARVRHQREEREFGMHLTRRRLLGSFVMGTGSILLAACGAAPSPTAVPAKPTEAPKPAASGPPAAAPAATTAPAPAPTTAPAAAPSGPPSAPAKPTDVAGAATKPAVPAASGPTTSG